MTYKDAITASMTNLGAQKEFLAAGYNVRYGRAAGTLVNVPEEKLIETPLAENLMTGMAIGLSLQGFVPVVYYERSDFLTCGMDAIVNHLDKLNTISEGVHRPACIIRVVVGNSKTPLFTGPTHVQCFADAMRKMVSFPVKELRWKTEIEAAYEEAWHNAKAGISTMLFDFKDLWNID